MRYSSHQARTVLKATFLFFCGFVFSSDDDSQVSRRLAAQSQLFSTIGAFLFTVPPGIFTLHVTLRGANGGDAFSTPYTYAGGLGGSLSGMIDATPGEILQVNVGGQGTRAGSGGSNGGGNSCGAATGGSGGGATDIRRPPYTLSDRFVVAGGGGGAFAATSVSSKGGDAGNPSGYFGSSYDSNVWYPGGGGGTATAGGIAGSSCLPGTFGRGSDCCSEGGGGGGGWYGGGSGLRAGAGGGSSLGVSGMASGSYPAGPGSATITWEFIPSAYPTRSPTRPTSRPSSSPSSQPSVNPSCQPTGQPAATPSQQPTSRPSAQPSSQPSRRPSSRPSAQPTVTPSCQPSRRPSAQPSGQPTAIPSSQPSSQPSGSPSDQPTNEPTGQPSGMPTAQPFSQPSFHPTAAPSTQPSRRPTAQPTSVPSTQPTSTPSAQPSLRPLADPTSQPNAGPSTQPSSHPSSQPTTVPSCVPSLQPSSQPSTLPSTQPSGLPTRQPNAQPSTQPSAAPSAKPSTRPRSVPTAQPSSTPSSQSSGVPSLQPTAQPSRVPTSLPTSCPSSYPSVVPSTPPSSTPTSGPSCIPTVTPSTQPTSMPSTRPTSAPTALPSAQPSRAPSSQPTGQPSDQPNAQPSAVPSALPSWDLNNGLWWRVLGNGTDAGQLWAVYDQLWACTGGRPVECTIAAPSSGRTLFQYHFYWDAISSAQATTDVNAVTLTGINTVNETSSTVIANCVLNTNLKCDVQTLWGVALSSGAYNAFTADSVYTGQYGSNAATTIVNAAGVYRGFYYINSAIKPLVITLTCSIPSFVGVFIAGTIASSAANTAASTYAIVAGWVRIDSGVLSAISLVPRIGYISKRANLVTVLAVESTGPDSFIGGGIIISPSDVGAHAYVVRTNVLFRSASFCVRYVIGGRRRRLMGESLVTKSVITGLTVSGGVYYALLNSVQETENGDRSSVSLVCASAENGAITKQVRVSVVNGSLECAHMIQVDSSLVVSCAVRYGDGPAQALLLSVDKALELTRLPPLITRSYDVLFTADTLPMKVVDLPVRTYPAPLTTTKSSTTDIVNSSPTRSPVSKPTAHPSIVPSATPSTQPTSTPTVEPSMSAHPTSNPSSATPTNTHKPSVLPTPQPTATPSAARTVPPTVDTTTHPTAGTTQSPTVCPSALPSAQSTVKPTRAPSIPVTRSPSAAPTFLAILNDDSEESTEKRGPSNKVPSYVTPAALGCVIGCVLIGAVLSYRRVQNQKFTKVDADPVPNENLAAHATPKPVGSIALHLPKGASADSYDDSIIVSSLHSSECSSEYSWFSDEYDEESVDSENKS